MKQILLLFAVLFLTASSAFAQPDYKCYTMEELERQKKENPHLEAQMQQFEEQVQLWIKEYKKAKGNQIQIGSGDVIKIPVVVHVLYNNQSQLKSLDIVKEQILTFCNRDFAGQNTNSMEAFYDNNLKANCGIEFVMAAKAPDGSPTEGVNFVPTYIYEFSTSNYMKFTKYGGYDCWDPKLYFNVWVCNTPGSVCWAQFPGSGINGTYGIVVDYAVFGSDALVSSRKNGSITTHEIGHCLDLRHIWGDDQGACSGDDYCADIPNQADYQYGCPKGMVYDNCTNTGDGIMYMNFMDYTNDYCVANFTPDQKNRMRACFAPGAPLEPFLSSTVGTPPAIGECHTPNSFYATDLKKTSAKLNWPNMVNALSYNIQYRKTTSNTWLTTTSNTNSKQFTGLARSTPYECKVQSVCSGGTSNWSHIFIFSTLSSDPPTSLAKVNLVSPNDGQTGVPANTTITWQTVTGASSYFILYSKTSDFSACYIATTSSTSMTLSRLEVNMQYYWKVRANYAEIFGEWSDYRSFTTGNFEATPPVLRFPINNQMGVSTSPAFYWYTAIGANSYNLQYSTSSTFQTYEQKSNITGTTYIASGLSNRTTYYWRMNSNYNGLPPSDWSTVWKFKTVNSGKYGIPEESGVETTAASLSFAPNPFSDVTHFKLEVFENANVMIEISDALGRKVATLANESYKPGNYEFDFNAMNLLTGVYYCHLISGDEVRTMQMVIMK